LTPSLGAADERGKPGYTAAVRGAFMPDAASDGLGWRKLDNAVFRSSRLPDISTPPSK
jgi:hypothetical protein